MKTLISIFAMIFLNSALPNAFSQEAHSSDGYLFSGKNKYSQAIIYLDDDETTIYKTNSLVIENDTLTIKPSKNQLAKKVSLDRVYLIKTQKGSKAIKYAIWGTLIGGGLGFLAAVQAVENAQNQAIARGEFVTNGDEIIRYGTIGGVTAGLLIGGIYGS